MFEYPVVFVDIETTGGSYRSSRVLEVAAIRYEQGKVVKEYTTLINPQSYIPANITQITGIRESDVRNSPVFGDIADELYEILDGAVFIAHNVRFDYSFLKNEFALIGMRFNPRQLCTVRLSRALYAHEKGHSLAKLIERHSIPVLDRHRALADTQAILYFAQLAYDTHGNEAFSLAVSRQLKSQTLPPNLSPEQMADIPSVPGVYIFKDEMHQPVYIGKSIHLRKRVLSHFQDISPKELKIAQSTHHIETIPTGSELAALILESKLIKEQMPLYNRKLRRVSSYAILLRSHNENKYAYIDIRQGKIDATTDLTSVYGVYETRTKAKRSVEQMTRTFNLCPKLMGYEKTQGACFSYSLGTCKGACIGEESSELYNRRFELALEHHRLAHWPYKSPIVIPINQAGERVIIDNWIVQGFLNESGEPVLESFESNFDVDEYKIIKRFIRENSAFIQPYPTQLSMLQ